MATKCPEEPWGRYSASGGLFRSGNGYFIYSFGGDTTSDADGRGGVVRTHWRYALESNCWEQLNSTTDTIGYRATATQLSSDEDTVYVFGGSDGSRQALVERFWKYSLARDTWTEIPLASESPTPRWKHAAVAISDTEFLVTGGRGETVYDDAWIFNAENQKWNQLNTTLLPIYRHGMAFDSKRNVAWIYGGLDASFSRYNGQLWLLNLTTANFTEILVDSSKNPPPARLASHAMEYIPELDVLLLFGGSCSDDSEIYIYDIDSSGWCQIFPSGRPDRRDAMIWAMQYPNFYISQGDSICYSQQVLPITDVHMLNLTSHTSIEGGEMEWSWKMLYEPSNARGSGREPYCTGSNGGNCQPRPRLLDMNSRPSTCSSDLLKRFPTTLSTATSTSDPTTSPTFASSSQVADELLLTFLLILLVIRAM